MLIKRHNKKYFVVLMSEIFPQKLDKFNKVDAWVQIACPRLSIDWGHHFTKPLLSSYEAFAMLGEAAFPTKPEEKYPMDFYSDEGGQWTNYW
jgi:2-(3-amino-3-carboxypropyl)histidine synthase